MSRLASSRSARADRHHGPRRNRTRRGISLVEILVAIILIAVALGGALKSSAAVAQQMGGGMWQTVAAGVAQTRLDSLASLSCAQLVGGLTGSSTSRGITEAWSVVDGRNTKTLSVTLTLPRRVSQPVYSTVIPCRD